jgi:D-tyrosyl-tRNA(Tyr) deacylase
VVWEQYFASHVSQTRLCRESEPVAAGTPLPQRTLLGEIGRGLLVLLGIGKNDTQADADWMINKLLNLRIFPDDAHNMNCSVTDISGEILVVSQFTLCGDARKGTRPSFTDAMPPAEAEKFYNEFMAKLRAATPLKVAEGKFAAMMDVELVNDGPVTIVLESPVAHASSLRPANNRKLEACATSFSPFDPTVVVSKTHRRLPHWQQEGRTYFVTFRLADSLPHDKLERWMTEREAWRRAHPAPLTPEQQEEYDRLFDDRFQEWLDAGHGECTLRQPQLAHVVAESLRHFHGERYELTAFVIMPNHMHALVTPVGEWSLEQIVHSWKSYTANQINRTLERTGQVWQHESFDHIVRDEQALLRFYDYIRLNPIRAGLKEGEYVYGE